MVCFKPLVVMEQKIAFTEIGAKVPDVQSEDHLPLQTPQPNPPMILYGCSIFITRANDVTNIRRMNPLQSEEKMIDTKANECLSFKKVGRFSKAQPPFASIKMS